MRAMRGLLVEAEDKHKYLQSIFTYPGTYIEQAVMESNEDFFLMSPIQLLKFDLRHKE